MSAPESSETNSNKGSGRSSNRGPQVERSLTGAARPLLTSMNNQDQQGQLMSHLPTFQRPRSLFKFILDLRRWSTPKTSHQWQVRVRNNLLYFQTNYVILAMMTFVLFMLLSMKTIVTGVLSAGLIVIAILFFTDHLPHAREIKRNHPNVVVVASIIMIILAWHSVYTLLVVLSALLSSLPLWLLHASLRDSSNLVGPTEAITSSNRYASSPMGHLMSLFMVEPKVSVTE